MRQVADGSGVCGGRLVDPEYALGGGRVSSLLLHRHPSRLCHPPGGSNDYISTIKIHHLLHLLGSGRVPLWLHNIHPAMIDWRISQFIRIMFLYAVFIILLARVVGSNKSQD